MTSGMRHEKSVVYVELAWSIAHSRDTLELLANVLQVEARKRGDTETARFIEYVLDRCHLPGDALKIELLQRMTGITTIDSKGEMAVDESEVE